MASNSKPLRIPVQTNTSKPSNNNLIRKSISYYFLLPTQHHQLQNHSHLSISHLNQNPLLPKSRILFTHTHSSIKCSLSQSPPTTKEEAILQAKTSLLSTLEKPLNNPKLATGKIKKLKQPRFRVEIPVIDDSPSSLSQLAVEIFGNMSVKRKGPNPKILLLWSNQSLKQAAVEAFDSDNILNVQNLDLFSILDEDARIVNSADVVVFLAPEDSQLEVMKTVTDSFYPKPVVIFNPGWSFEDETNFGEMSGFVGTFEVVYSFMGLEVRGILSKKKGVVFKCVKDGVLSDDKWNVFVEEEAEEFRVVSRFKSRPSITEVENVLYNLMAINSPVTKSAKFLKNLVSNVTGKK